MKIITAEWFNSMTGCIGIVVGEDEITGERKAYMGPCQGMSEQLDSEYILREGAKVYALQLEMILKNLRAQ